MLNLGGIYFAQKNYPKAIENYQRALIINEEFGDNMIIAAVQSSIGEVYTQEGNYVEALKYNELSLNLREEIGDKSGIATSLGNIGQVYLTQGDYNQALKYFQDRLLINKEIGYKKEIDASLGSIGSIYNAQSRYIDALDACQKAMKLSKEIGVLHELKEACSCMYQAQKNLGHDKEALMYYEQLQVVVDSINLEETKTKLQKMEFAEQVLSDSLASAEKSRLINEAHQAEVRQKNQTRNMLAGGGILVLLLAGGVYSRLRYTRRSKAVLQIEKDRSDNLLLNILPADIAEELKIHGKAEARDFDMVSILFTDFKGFTEASSKMTAGTLVGEINACFEAFDGICEKYEVEKIKTIGDAYMAAGGLPIPDDSAAENTVRAALEMQDFIIARKTERDTQGLPAFEMRVGVHTGPVVAGIVGVKKFQYDIWDDTVNTASRMESSGEVGKVNISQATYEQLKSDADFTFESRGKIVAKGKGKVEMYFVSKSKIE